VQFFEQARGVGPALARGLARDVGDHARHGPAGRLDVVQPPRDDLERAPAADAELLVVVRGEVHLGVEDVLAPALGQVTVHHADVVALALEAAAHREPQRDELAEVLEGVELAQVFQTRRGQLHVVPARHLPQRLGRDRALEVQVHLGLRHSQQHLSGAQGAHSKAFLASSTPFSNER
jgi:hypothetical protein